jgi:hypothetical protein
MRCTRSGKLKTETRRETQIRCYELMAVLVLKYSSESEIWTLDKADSGGSD